MQFVSSFVTVLIGALLWLTAVVATPLLLYYLFATEVVGARKAAVSERMDGAFLFVIVCMQSLAILGGLLSALYTACTLNLAGVNTLSALRVVPSTGPGSRCSCGD